MIYLQALNKQLIIFNSSFTNNYAQVIHDFLYSRYDNKTYTINKYGGVIFADEANEKFLIEQSKMESNYAKFVCSRKI